MSRPTPVRIRPPQLAGLEVLRPHAALVSAEDRVRPPAGPLEERAAGRRGRRRRRKAEIGVRLPGGPLQAGGRQAVSRRPWEPDSVGSIPTPLTDTGLWSNGTTPAW